MSITKNMLLSWYSSMKKKLRKLQMIFNIENWLWKSNFGTFWQLLNTLILQIWWFQWLILSQKTFLILYLFLENSTTSIAILFTMKLFCLEFLKDFIAKVIPLLSLFYLVKILYEKCIAHCTVNLPIPI